jgi:MFS family permease
MLFCANLASACPSKTIKRWWERIRKTMVRVQLSPLWRNTNFLKLWTGETVSLIGTQVTLIALPLTASFTLHASVFQMGILAALETLPIALFGLFIGVWVDRHRRRPLLIGANIGRMLLLSFLPIAAFFHELHIELLYLVAFLTGILSTVFALAYRPFLPNLIEEEQLLEGNSKLEVSRSLAQTCGPGLGGVLVQVMTAPFAIALDAFSYLISTVSLLAIRASEHPPRRSNLQGTIVREIGEGLHFLLGNATLRTIAICTGCGIFFQSITLAVYILYVTRELTMSPVILGGLYTLSGIGGLIGAFLAEWVSRRVGVGASLIGTEFLIGLSALLIPLAGIGPFGIPLVTLLLLGLSRLFQGAFLVIYDINWISLSQVMVPSQMQGRLNATLNLFLFLLQPVGFLLGGVLGTVFGLRLTLLLAAVGWSLVFLVPFCSPLRTLRTLPMHSSTASTP